MVDIYLIIIIIEFLIMKLMVMTKLIFLFKQFSYIPIRWKIIFNYA